MAILKNVGKGILYIIGLPFFLLVLALTAVFGIFLLVFMFFKSIILFFTGRSLDDDLPEDIQVKEIKNGRNNTSTISNEPRQEVQEEPIVQPYVAPTTGPSSIEEAVFGHQTYEAPVEEPAQPEFIEEPIEEEQLQEEAPIEEPISSIDVSDSPIQDNTTEIDIGQYTPHTSGSVFIDEEEEEEDSGVTITYGDDDD